MKRILRSLFLNLERKLSICNHVGAKSRNLAKRAGQKKLGRHPAIGALKGTFTIEPGYDLTQPTLDPDWEQVFDEKWGALLK